MSKKMNKKKEWKMLHPHYVHVKQKNIWWGTTDTRFSCLGFVLAFCASHIFMCI